MPKQSSRLEGERKQVSAVFLDLVDFSSVASEADPEDLQDWLEEYYNQSREIVEVNGGEITEYLGDGVVAVFGLSQANEHAALRAVDAALNAVTNLGSQLSTELKLGLRAGVATGEVVVRGAPDRSVWPRITGMVTTLAQRVQERAAPGTVMISASTEKLLRNAFPVTAFPRQNLKGFTEPQTLYRPEHRASVISGPMATAIVGRSDEYFRIIKADKAVLIVGQAGVGKSALAGKVACKSGQAIMFQADRLDNGSSYQPFRDWLLHRLDIRRPGMEDIQSGFPGLSDQDYRGLALMLGLPEGQALLAELSNLAVKSRIETGIWRAIRTIQSAGTLLFEDLHWFDTASFGVIQHILRSPESADYKQILTSREDARLDQHLKGEELAILALDPLSPDAAQRMLEQLGGDRLEEAVRKQLVDRSGGVPLFLEQLYHSDGGRGLSGNTVPSTLMDLLAERIDRTGAAKPVLQRAAALGRPFKSAMLTALDPDKSDVGPAIAQGASAGVLVQQAEDVWTFSHALLAEATYQSVLHKTREALHARIVEVLIEQTPDIEARDPAFLADHQRRAGQTLPAIRSYLAASRRALLHGGLADAETHARVALTLCSDLDDDHIRAEHAISCQTALGSILMQAQGFTAEPVRHAFEAVHDIARSVPTYSIDSAAALFGSFSHAIIAGDKQRADGLSDLLADLAASVPEGPTRTEAILASLAVRNGGNFYQGEFHDQFEQFAQIRQIYRIEEHARMITHFGMDIFAAAQMFEGPARAITGQTDRVPGLIEETDAHQDALNIPAMLPYAEIWGAVPLLYSGRCEEALTRLERGVSRAVRQGAAFWEITGKTWGFIIDPERSVSSRGLEDFAANVEQQRSIGANVGVPYFAACLADRLAAAGRLTEAYRVSSSAVKQACHSGLHCWYAEILRIHASICRRTTYPAEAIAAQNLALDTARRQGAMLWWLRTLLDMAETEPDLPNDLELAISGFPVEADLPETTKARKLLTI